jgi:hypothetical protein
MMNNQVNPMQMLTQFKQNPMQFLIQRRLNVPQNLMNDPQGILNHLLQTKQISQDDVNRAYQMMGQFRR